MGRIAGMTAEAVRERLLTAAAEVFVERGYEGARTSEIARRAGLSTGAIYSRYQTKAELLGHAIAAHIPSELDDLFAAGSSDTAIAVLGDLARRLPTRTREHGAMLLEALAAARRDPDVAKMITAGVRNRVAGLEAAIGQAQHDGLAREDLRSEALAHFCMTVVLGTLIMNTLDLPRPGQDEWGAVIDHLIGSVRAGPGEPDRTP
jgi:TetR/AcrR family transcriptional repressor of uid operon